MSSMCNRCWTKCSMPCFQWPPSRVANAECRTVGITQSHFSRYSTQRTVINIVYALIETHLEVYTLRSAWPASRRRHSGTSRILSSLCASRQTLATCRNLFSSLFTDDMCAACWPAQGDVFGAGQQRVLQCLPARSYVARPKCHALGLYKQPENTFAPSSRRDTTMTAASNKHYFMDCWGGPDNQIHCQYLSPYDLSRCTSGLSGKAESNVVGCLQRHGHVSFAFGVLCMAVTTLLSFMSCMPSRNAQTVQQF